ncbi:hypothetical protein SAMN04488067_105188 [Halorubrum xinjiangense]|uniref:CAAX prenyl protease 2/Lysostaphin resistance protein A-like domain-containing protein n=1 Tax=Halorubrum xinjiangense TaxID=261291 RepID=A0A1G7M3N4_9EURY|nr:hypothetical protein SAMN04488067_105188 [Halorubrum xinjiangense]
MRHRSQHSSVEERDSRVAAFVDRYQLIAFIALTFAWSWGAFVLLIQPLGLAATQLAQVVFAWGPLVGAVVVTAVSGDSVREWAAQIDPRTTRLRWYLIALATPLLLTDGSRVLAWIAGAPVTAAEITVLEFLSQFAVTLVVAGALEEFGWRGFAQPRLQERWSALTAALLIGLVWALWHFPLVYGGTGAGYGAGAFVGFLIGLPVFSVAMAWIYNGTSGGLLFVMLFHAMINAPSPLQIADTAPSWAQTVGELGQLGFLLVVPLVLTLYYGREYLAASQPTPLIPGRRQ